MYTQADQLEFPFIDEMIYEEEFRHQQLLDDNKPNYVQVSHSMARDAGDLNLEGQWIEW